MSKFHVGPGGPGPCGADKGNCPYGGDSGLDDHFDTLEEAQSFFEKKMTEEYGSSSTVATTNFIESFGNDDSYTMLTDTIGVDSEGKHVYISEGGDKYAEEVETFEFDRWDGAKVRNRILKDGDDYYYARDQVGGHQQSIGEFEAQECLEDFGPPIPRWLAHHAVRYSNGEMVKEDDIDRIDEAFEMGFTVPPKKGIEGYMGGGGWKGGKADTIDSYSNVDRAKAIRQDLKTAEKEGWLPEGLKYSVRSGKYSIALDVLNLPDDSEVYRRNNRGESELNTEYGSLEERLQAIHDSYNYNRSNAMVDYFDSGYGGRVQLLNKQDQYSRDEGRISRSIKRKVNKMKKDGATEAQINSSPEIKEQVKELLAVKELYWKEVGRNRTIRDDWRTERRTPDHIVDAEGERYSRERMRDERRRFSRFL